MVIMTDEERNAMLLAGIATALPDGISEVLDEHKIGGLLVFGSKRNPPGFGIALGARRRVGLGFRACARGTCESEADGRQT